MSRPGQVQPGEPAGKLAASESCRVYERLAGREKEGAPIRPGGLQLTQSALAHCNFAAGAQLLDVGCGNGATVDWLRQACGWSACGIDPSVVMLRSAPCGRRRLPLLQAAGEALPFGEASFDGVLLECSLSVTVDPARTVSECGRVLKPGGRLILSDVYARNEEGLVALRQLPMHCCLTGALTQQELQWQLQSNGFSIDLWQDHSRALAEFTAQLIFSHGSLQQFWQCTAAGSFDSAKFHSAMRHARPGYFLLIACKH